MSETATAKPIAAATSLRGASMRAVQIWAVELEALMAGNSKHPLHRIREAHLANIPNHQPPARRPVTLKTETGERTVWILSQTARASATRSSSGSKPPVVNIGSRSAAEVHSIMRHVHVIDPRYWQVLLLWGLGFTLADQAAAKNKSRSTIEKWFEGGLGVVQSALLCRTFSD